MASGFQMTCVMAWQKVCLHFVHVQRLPETEIRGDGLINLAEEISRQSNVEAVAWLLLGAFGQTCVENQEQRAQQNDLKCFELG